MKNFFNIFKKSIFSPNGKESSTRISSYIILLIIVIFSFSFISLEWMNINISNESIVIFGMILTHHITLLGINKYHENKINDAKENNI